MLTQAELKELFYYDPVTGLFLRIRRCGNRLPNSDVGSVTNYGYLRIAVNKKLYFAHVLAWLYVYGEFPKKHIDHVDNSRINNRISNLRLASKIENAQNMTTSHKDSKYGRLGVYLHKASGLYHARIMLNGKQFSLGYFNDPDLAHLAYLEKKRSLHQFNQL